MFGIFKKKSPISETSIDMTTQNFAWLLKNFGGPDFYDGAKLVLPTQEFFPESTLTGEKLARATFEIVKKYAGLENWPCHIESQSTDIDPVVSSTLIVHDTPSDPLGSFGMNDDEEVVITYNPRIVHQPSQMVATFAHELAHYLLATASDPPPGGWDLIELTTDITCHFLGFGLFLANTASDFKQFQDYEAQGWSMQRNGYLGDNEHLYALALFAKLKNLPLEVVSDHLKVSLKRPFKSLFSSVEDTQIEMLRSIKLRQNS